MPYFLRHTRSRLGGVVDQHVGTSEHAHAVTSFRIAFEHAPTRVGLVEIPSWVIVAANSAARGDAVRVGLDPVGVNIRSLLSTGQREPFLVGPDGLRTAEFDVLSRLEPPRIHRVALWALDGFDGRYVVVAGRDPDLAPFSASVLPTPLPATLTVREREIVEMILLGLRVPSIAKSLYLSEHTIRNHLRSVFTKCDVRSQRELVDKLRS